MDFKAVIQYIANHYVLISGTTLALFFTTSMILLIRSIGEKGERNVGGSSELDLNAIEGAMKRVLSSQPVSVIAGSLPAPSVTVVAGEEGASGLDAAQVDAMNAALRERESTIDELRTELSQAKDTIAQMAESTGGADPDEVKALRSKLDELQARLAEYEIIEDDIADLSMYKDENARLKAEVEKLKAAGPAAAVAEAPAAAPSIKFEKVDSFELDPNDDIMKEFAAAVDSQAAPPPPAAEKVAPPSPEEQAKFVQAAAVDPQAAIDALLMGDAAAPAAPAASSAPAAAPVDPQAAIDALLMGDAAVPADPPPFASTEQRQQAIDALLMGDAALPEPTVSPVDAQAAQQAEIDALMAGAAPAPASAPAAPASAAEVEDPLAGTPDPEKLLSEVAAIQGQDAPTDDAGLEEELNTDKLLAEVDSLKAGSAAATNDDVDDIFAEFNKKAAGG